MKKPFARKFFSIAFVSGLGSSFALADTKYTEICGTPAMMASLLGPRLLTDAESKAAEKGILAANKNFTERTLREQIAKDGLFASSPYAPNDLKAEEKIDKICLLLAVGGVSFSVKDSIERNKDVANKEEAAMAVQRAIRESDRHCFSHLHSR